MNRLKNKVAVITGGNSGIGFGIAEAFKNEDVVGTIVGRNKETLTSAAAQLGDDFIAINADVTNLDDLERVFKETAEKFGKIDLVVANAGAGTTGTVADTTEADFDNTMDLNSVFLASDDSSFMLGAELLVDGGMTYLSK